MLLGAASETGLADRESNKLQHPKGLDLLNHDLHNAGYSIPYTAACGRLCAPEAGIGSAEKLQRSASYAVL